MQQLDSSIETKRMLCKTVFRNVAAEYSFFRSKFDIYRTFSISFFYAIHFAYNNIEFKEEKKYCGLIWNKIPRHIHNLMKIEMHFAIYIKNRVSTLNIKLMRFFFWSECIFFPFQMDLVTTIYLKIGRTLPDI